MRFLFILLILIAIAYGWFATYEPTPSADSMQGVVNNFQQAIFRRDLQGMRRWCTPQAADQCGRILEEITAAEQRLGTTLASVGSLGFDYPRGRREVDGIISGQGEDSETLFQVNARVSQQGEGAGWLISHIQ